MPAIDYENCWYALKAHISAKRSHGAAELAEEMAAIEVRHLIPERHQGFDDRPIAVHNDESSDTPADEGSEMKLREPAHVVSAHS